MRTVQTPPHLNKQTAEQTTVMSVTAIASTTAAEVMYEKSNKSEVLLPTSIPIERNYWW